MPARPYSPAELPMVFSHRRCFRRRWQKIPGVVIITSQSLRFLKPVRIYDTITAVVEVVRTDKEMVALKQTCFN
ncbi:hotdog domain-containing protein [Chloroflexota bacterium]